MDARIRRFGGLLVALLALVPALCGAAEWTWQRQQARVLPQGDLEWQPEEFVFERGESVRYIDFEGGEDAAAGTSRDAAWKHHPWDLAATGRAAACSGVHTYVFKRGVIYRGALEGNESGEPGNPIRLTSDPSWGDGRAMIYGSDPVTSWQKGADHADIPETDKVWRADVDFTPRCVWMVDDGRISRLKLARTPNWEVSDPDEIKSEWWEWENPEWWKGDGHKTTVNGRRMHLGVDTEHLTKPADYYQDAIVWTEYGIMMGTPFASRVEAVEPDQNAVAFQGVWYGDSGQIIKGNRYYLEDKPHYLDEPGEFWFEKRGEGGRLYVRLPGDADPRRVTIEAARRLNLVDLRNTGHLHVSGLTFRFTNVADLTARTLTETHEEVDGACVRMLGSGRDLCVSNCRFEHVNKTVRVKAVGDDDYVDGVAVCDNEILNTDHGAIDISDGTRWGKKVPPIGQLGRVEVVRNRLHRIGLRPVRSEHGHAVTINFPAVAEIAGNILHRCYGAGLFIFGGKSSGYRGDAPLSRILIHHNEVVDPLLNTNDWGGIETWQSGPYYVYNNVSGNPGGYMNWRYNPEKPGSARFGHAYYMDGSFKNYQFNNIAWGKNNEPGSIYCNTSAFQEIISYQNTVFNNTIYRFLKGSRRQKPEAGRDKFMGNIWQDISEWVFWHAPAADAEADPNVYQVSETGEDFAYETLAYASNVFANIAGNLGVFEASGVPRPELRQMRGALQAREAIAGDVGVQTDESVLRDPANHDFRPAPGSAAADSGVKVFVPWGLYAMVGEWNFYPAGDDPTRVLDEHWYLTPYHVGREGYLTRPMYPLTAVNVDADDYTAGPLEDWTKGALELNGRDQYLMLTDEKVDEPFRMESRVKLPEGGWAKVTLPERAIPGEPFEVKVELTEAQPDQMVQVHLHWLKSNAFGGFNAWGGQAKSGASKGPHTWKFTPEDKPDLTLFSATVFLSPTGDFGERTLIDRVRIPKAEPGAETGSRTVTLGGGDEEAVQWISVAGEDLKNPEVHTSNFLIEAYLRTGSGASGVLAEKMADAGYSLTVNADGRAEFAVKGGGASARIAGDTALNDGRWHHVIAEADRDARTLTLYVDGKRDASGAGVGSDVSLVNDGDLYVGGTPDGRCLDCTLEFMRVSRGTLADARTSIEELYDWQFNGPFLRDFTGRDPVGARDAGAIEGGR